MKTPIDLILIDSRQLVILEESPVYVNRILNMAIVQARPTAFRDELIELNEEWGTINKTLQGLEREGEPVPIGGRELFRGCQDKPESP